MSVCRLALGAAALDGFVYAVGGANNSQCLDTVERYDPFRNEWIRVASLGTRRYAVSVSVLNGCLYAVALVVAETQLYAVGGACGGGISQETVEVFDFETSQWRHHSCMNERRFAPGVAVIQMP
ncbi:kelch repeat protein [Teladorsagia circumcincta]|uniref:Kelch repeat protein n=1 Tax=Teladorsagia circumcincta TaxID=45464 RepID=A0A2G9TBG0_TELCI|nr:kelch repeat protein [Teladorsagia circumcincta]